MRISKNIRKNVIRAAVVLIAALTVVAITLPSAHAAPVVIQASDINSGGSTGLPHVQANSNTVQNVLKIAFGIIGSFALLNLTLSGFKYITSAGDPQKTSEAKNGIVYSVVGLIIAITAGAIVAFVLHNVGSP